MCSSDSADRAERERVEGGTGAGIGVGWGERRGSERGSGGVGVGGRSCTMRVGRTLTYRSRTHRDSRVADTHVGLQLAGGPLQ